MIKLIALLKEAEEEQKCPIATQNVEVNLKHRQIAIDRYGYGPLNPNNPNIKFWREKAEMWKLDSIDEAKECRCHNCAAFNVTTKMLNCIEVGLSSGEKEVTVKDEPTPDTTKTVTEAESNDVEDKTSDNIADKDAWDTIEAGKLGYCTMHKFKCAGSRTCSAWIVGGPVKDK
jgi:hypothetical protein